MGSEEGLPTLAIYLLGCCRFRSEESQVCITSSLAGKLETNECLRAFESSALRLLLKWASKSVESSINQPTLPHAIIVLNATSTEIDPDEWDVKTATERLLAHVGHAVTEVEFFRLYTEHWRKRPTGSTRS
jgi:hypothetical protein